MTDIRFLFENLFINKYDLKYIKRPERSVMQVVATKKDEFGFDIEYQFFFLTELIAPNTISRYRRLKHKNLLLIGTDGQAGADLTEAGFYDKLDTMIDPGTYLNPDLGKILDLLGHNQLPAGMSGKPDDLLEGYVKECLQFMLGGKRKAIWKRKGI